MQEKLERRFSQPLVAHLRGDAPFYTAEYRVLGRDGDYRWILNRGLGVRNAIGQIDRMAGRISRIAKPSSTTRTEPRGPQSLSSTARRRSRLTGKADQL